MASASCISLDQGMLALKVIHSVRDDISPNSLRAALADCLGDLAADFIELVNVTTDRRMTWFHPPVGVPIRRLPFYYPDVWSWRMYSGLFNLTWPEASAHTIVEFSDFSYTSFLVLSAMWGGKVPVDVQYHYRLLFDDKFDRQQRWNLRDQINPYFRNLLTASRSHPPTN